jgi:hypothetical protein
MHEHRFGEQSPPPQQGVVSTLNPSAFLFGCGVCGCPMNSAWIYQQAFAQAWTAQHPVRQAPRLVASMN